MNMKLHAIAVCVAVVLKPTEWPVEWSMVEFLTPAVKFKESIVSFLSWKPVFTLNYCLNMDVQTTENVFWTTSERLSTRDHRLFFLAFFFFIGKRLTGYLCLLLYYRVKPDIEPLTRSTWEINSASVWAKQHKAGLDFHPSPPPYPLLSVTQSFNKVWLKATREKADQNELLIRSCKSLVCLFRSWSMVTSVKHI